MTASNNTVPTTSRYATHPFPLIPTPIYTEQISQPYPPTYMAASAMALAHNTFIRGLNTIYLQALQVPAARYLDFINYCLSFVESVNSHHRMEEQHAFPAIESACGVEGLMEGNVEQHHAFTPGLEAFHAYLLKTQPNPTSFSPAHMISLVDDFSEPFVKHLTEEIPTILALETHNTHRGEDPINFFHIFNKHASAAARKVSKTGGTPFFLRNLDLEYEGGLWGAWPGIPAPVSWILNQTVVRWNSGWWEFASCDAQGRMRELSFLGEGSGGN